MTSGPDLPERDPALERAWRAHSRETPPVELDRAILAAAHRAVGSGPRQTSNSPEAKQPQRWWMPLAAAATIGAIAVGVLQLAPQDAGIVAPKGTTTDTQHHPGENNECHATDRQQNQAAQRLELGPGRQA